MTNILIVDDNLNNLRLLSNILTDFGYETRRAINGNLALQAVEASNFRSNIIRHQYART